jgi:hypothetical protein
MALAKTLPGLEGLAAIRARKDVFAHWGDPLSQAGESYVSSCVSHTKTTSGHILQCGAGLMTLLMGIVCAQRDGKAHHIWCLTDDRHWANVIRSWLTQYGVSNAHVIVSRPRMYDNFVWYEMDPARLPDGFTLALCDGGRACVDGAAGLLERMGTRLGEERVILARHVTAHADQTFLQRWAADRGLHCTVVDKATGFLKII